jgi:hypothetical protein
MASPRVVANPAHARNRLIPGSINEQPAFAMALIEQIFYPTVKQLAQLGRTSGLLEMPEQGAGALVQWPQLQGSQRRTTAPFGLDGSGPAPELIRAKGLESMLP